jgi:hypothetical protein
VPGFYDEVVHPVAQDVLLAELSGVLDIRKHKTQLKFQT